ncbi:SAM-dependent methyltransferase [Lentilactobacillus kosonis]|uniref:Cobalt-precorrin-2 C20-methyltransferase n=1 Tax=Lentilactobacillus kosonis TaxID=2810561 RepID=A0A401FMN7_9LACO|nr:cobalt-precorrin-2 C20-methyltransferase [Lentilactobacillus kosonis]
MAKFYGIGIGPGDSELVTVKAANTVKSLDILYTPKAHNDSLSTAEKLWSLIFQTKLKLSVAGFQ